MAGDNARKLLNSNTIKIFTQFAADNWTTLWTGGWKQNVQGPRKVIIDMISTVSADRKQYRTFRDLYSSLEDYIFYESYFKA